MDARLVGPCLLFWLEVKGLGPREQERLIRGDTLDVGMDYRVSYLSFSSELSSGRGLCSPEQGHAYR